MTKLTPGGTNLKRETACSERGEPLVVELHARFIMMWVKGQPSTKVMIGYDAIYDLGRKLASRRLAMEKRDKS